VPQARPANPVYILPHAQSQALKRFPELRDHRDPVGKMYREVVHGIRDGRVSKSRPSWATATGRRRQIRHGPAGHHRFTWNEEETRAYAMKRERGQWIVKTVLTRLP
jgi:hypothetical protein